VAGDQQRHQERVPRRLLDVLDRLNRWLYSPRSPLNWFTKRREMEVVPRTPSHSKAGERLWNGAGLGQVFFDEQGRPARVYQLNADGAAATEFVRRGERLEVWRCRPLRG
jgi:hypothetical protein